MKRINVEQGSPEWLGWRKTVITATDCPAIMGSSPWQTGYKCWQRKLGLVEEQKSNAAMERGKELEPIARHAFISETLLRMSPAVVESTDHNFLGASLDGITDEGKYILEIKCGGEKLHQMAERGVIPEYYEHQMQHQLLVTGAEKCYYYSFNGTSGIIIEVFPDPLFAINFLPIAQEFWKGVVYFEPPALTQKDYKDMSDNLSWHEYATMYREINAILKANEDKKDYIRRKLIELCDGESSSGHGVKVCNIATKGRIDYDRIPEIRDLDLNKYRKETTHSWKIMLEKSN